MEKIKGWDGVRLMLTRPVWMFVLPTAAIVPLLLRTSDTIPWGHDRMLACAIGVVLAGMTGLISGAKLRTGEGKFEYIAGHAFVGMFAGLPVQLIGALFAIPLAYTPFKRSADELGVVAAGVLSFVGLLVYAYRRGVKPHGEEGGGGQLDRYEYGGPD